MLLFLTSSPQTASSSYVGMYDIEARDDITHYDVGGGRTVRHVRKIREEQWEEEILSF